MYFKTAGITLLALSLVWGCQNSTKNQDSQNTETSQPVQPMQGQDHMMQAEDVTDEELSQFVSAMEQMQVINQSAQQEMVGAVQQGGMEVERFSEIMQSEQDPNQPANATTEEMEKYAEVNQALEEIQIRAQQEMEEKISEAGLTTERYQQIGSMIQSSPELQQKLQTIEPTTN
jgi:hypothetical protein